MCGHYRLLRRRCLHAQGFSQHAHFTCSTFVLAAPSHTEFNVGSLFRGTFSQHLRSLAFLAKMQTSDQLAGRKHIINEERKAWFVGFSAICCMQQNQTNRRLSVHFVCNKSTILCTFYHVNVQSNSVHNSTMPLMRGNALQAFGWSCLLVLRVSLVCISLY